MSAGGIFELLIPAIVWQFGRFGKFDGPLRIRIRLGESLLRQPVVSHDEAQHWDASTQQVLRKYIGGEWHQEFRRYDNFDTRQPQEINRRAVISGKLHALISLRKTLENRETFVIPDRKVKLT